MKVKNMKIETRNIELSAIEDDEIQTRAQIDENGKRYIMGYAALKNASSQKITERINGEIRTFTETISDNAFNDTDMSSILHLVDHQQDKIIGRTGVNTTVQLTDKGLFFRTEIPQPDKATTVQEDLYRNAEQNIVKGASFAFRVAQGGDNWEKKNGQLYRTIHKIEKVVDVTSTFNGAYSDAFTFVRSLDESLIQEVTTEEKEAVTYDAKTFQLDFEMSLLKVKTF